MLSMEHDIRVGKYRIGAVVEVKILKSVERLCDEATVVLPGRYGGEVLDVEDVLGLGDPVSIKLGYGKKLKTEFEGYVKAIRSDDGTTTIECEDELWQMRKDVPDKVYKNIDCEALLKEVCGCTVSCDYVFKWDTFTVKGATAYDVLKKVQDETKANIYFKGGTLHVHPQYKEYGEKVVYDTGVNIESSSLKWRRADERSYLVEVEGIGKDGKRITVTEGRTGGDKRSVKVYGVTDKESLKARAKEELAMLVYTGYEGSVEGWLTPYCEPTYRVRLRDGEHPDREGEYYCVSTEVDFSSSGGKRKVTIGKKI